VDQHLRQ